MTVTANTLIHGNSYSENSRDDTNNFLSLTGGRSGANAVTSGEANIATKVNIAGVLSHWAINVIVSGASNTQTVQIRKNAAAGNNTIAAPGSTAGLGIFKDTTHTDSVAAGDKINWRVTGGNFLQNWETGSTAIEYSATSDTAWFSYCYGGGQQTTASQTAFLIITGTQSTSAGSFGTSEASAQVKFRAGSVSQRAGINVTANTDTNAATFLSRKNTANGNQTVAIGTSGTTGYLEDTTHTDSLASGDLFCFGLTVGAATVALSLSTWGHTVECATSSFDIIAQTGANLSTSVDVYGEFGGTQFFDHIEQYRQVPLLFAAVFGNLRINAPVMTGTAWSGHFRNNGIDGSQAFVGPASTTGYQEDTTHTDSVPSGNLIGFHAIHPTSGTTTISCLGITAGPSNIVVPPGSLVGNLWASGI